MILVVGPAAAGKRDFVMEQWGYQPQQLSNACLDDSPVIYNAQQLAFDQPQRVGELARQLQAYPVVIINELGAGIIPATRAEREGRDAAGRLGVLLAQAADQVHRVLCGLPQRIK